MWNDRYDRAEYVYGTAPNDFLAEQANRLKPESKVLCLAEGEGRNAVFLARAGHQVTAVDSSAIGLNKANTLARQHGVEIRTLVEDLADLALRPESWDAIISIFAHVPPAVRRHVHRQVVQGLKPGGLMLLEAYTPAQIGNQTGGPPKAELMMDVDLLDTEFAGLDVDMRWQGTRTIVEGLGHTGPGAVVQYVARKPE